MDALALEGSPLVLFARGRLVQLVAADEPREPRLRPRELALS